MAAPHDAVHQINFGLQADDGVTVVGGTLPDENMLAWLRRLQVHLRLQRFGSALPPDRALSTFEFPDGWTAVVRRWSSGGTIGRNDAMALIAPSRWLPIPVALGLDGSFGWRKAAQQRPFQRWDAEQLQVLGDEGAQALREPAQREPAALRRALAQLLDAPDRPLTIVGCPDEQRIPLLWGLHKLAAPRLLQQNVKRAWTFSTYEVEDADSIAHLPAIVFLPERPVGATVSRRTFVDVRVDGNVSPASDDRAARRVELFLVNREGEPEFDALPPAPMPQALGLRQAPHTRREPVAGGGTTVAADPRPAADGGWADEELIYRPGGHPARDPAGTGRARPELVAAVARVHDAASQGELHECMSALERLAPTPDDRAGLRGQLGPTGVAQLAGVVTRMPSTEHQQASFFDHLQTITFGPDRADLRSPDASRFAVDVLATRPSPVLGVNLLADLRRNADPAFLDKEFARRWLDQLGLSDTGATAPDARRTADADAAAPGQRLWRTTPEDAPDRDAPGSSWWSRVWGSQLALPIGALAAVVIALLAVFTYVGLSDERAGTPPGASPSGAPAVNDVPTPAASTTVTTTAAATPTPDAGAEPTVGLEGSVAGQNLVVRLPKTDAPRVTEVYLLLRPVGSNVFYSYNTLCKDATEPDSWVCRQPVNLAALPASPTGYDVVLINKVGADPKAVERRDGLFTVDPPTAADYVVPPGVAVTS